MIKFQKSKLKLLLIRNLQLSVRKLQLPAKTFSTHNAAGDNTLRII